MTRTRPVPPRLAFALTLALAWPAAAAAQGVGPVDAMAPGRQVTVFGILATPGAAGKDDEKLKDVLPQLRALLPNHSFKLIKAESRRLVANGTIACDLGSGFVATSQLVTPLDANGKVQLRFDLSLDEISQYQTVVTTPPNQIIYCNRLLPDGSRLIIGIGAR